MALDITIKQKVFNKVKKFEIFPFALVGKFKPRLIPGIVGNDANLYYFDKTAYKTPKNVNVLIFDIKQLGRGFEFNYEENWDIHLRQPIPASDNDLNNFYDCADYIMEVCGVDVFYQDEIKYSRKDFDALKREGKNTSAKFLHHLSDDEEKYSNFKMFCSLCTVTLNADFWKNYKLADNKQKFFEEFLHNQQIEFNNKEQLLKL